MREELQRLIELQNVDTQLAQIASRRGSLTVAVDGLTRQIETTESEISDNQARLEEIVATILAREGRIGGEQDKLKRYQDQLLAVTTNREYDALTAEITTKEESVDRDETEVLELSEEQTGRKEQVKAAEETLKELQQDLKDNRVLLDKKIAETKEEEDVLAEKRKELVDGIGKSFVSSYERILAAKNGNAVVEIVDGACGGCFNRLPPQYINDARAMERIVSCEACGRIVVAAL